MNIYIYKHTSPSGKCYVGQTVNIKERWKAKSYQQCRKFYNAIKKYGWDNFEHEILCVCNTPKDANDKEAYYIKYYDSINNGYNIVPGGGEYLRGENNPMYGKSPTEFMTDEKILAWKKKLSVTNAGDKNGFYGKHHSEETKKKLREQRIGISHPLNLTDEQRRELSERSKGLWSKERRKQQADKMKGENNPMHNKQWTEEERQSLRERFSGGKSVLAKPIKITDTYSGEEIYCECKKYVKNEIGLDATHIHRYIGTDKLYRGRYKIEEVA